LGGNGGGGPPNGIDSIIPDYESACRRRVMFGPNLSAKHESPVLVPRLIELHLTELPFEELQGFPCLFSTLGARGIYLLFGIVEECCATIRHRSSCFMYT
jgi:hypothetical protein